jgi:hypothetical protein
MFYLSEEGMMHQKCGQCFDNVCVAVVGFFFVVVVFLFCFFFSNQIKLNQVILYYVKIENVFETCNVTTK